MISGMNKATGLVGAIALAASAFSLAPSTQAAQPSIKWDGGGMADISAPPFTWELELTDYTNPKEITKREKVEVEVELDTDIEPCSANLNLIPMRDGAPIGPPVPIDGAELYAYESVYLPVNVAGTYQLAIQGSIVEADLFCSSSNTTTTPYNVTIDLFTIAEDLPGPASRKKVKVTSSGPSTLVASTRSKSPTIRITFDIKDPEDRDDLLYRICMNDSYDCWFDDANIRKKSNIKKTADGWQITWRYWWERSSPSDCLSYYWQQPKVSVLLLVSNRDGRQIGRKKHGVRLTCRL